MLLHARQDHSFTAFKTIYFMCYVRHTHYRSSMLGTLAVEAGVCSHDDNDYMLSRFLLWFAHIIYLLLVSFMFIRLVTLSGYCLYLAVPSPLLPLNQVYIFRARVFTLVCLDNRLLYLYIYIKLLFTLNYAATLT